MHYFALLYDFLDVPDFVEKRAPFREDHLRRVREAHTVGQIVMAGALGVPPTGALLIFRGDSPAAAESFAREDPYVIQQLVTRWQVRPWSVVIGG